MKTASLKQLKTELSTLHPDKLLELCIRLTKYKKENKELLSYLLFEADDEISYIKSVKNLVDEQYENINLSHLYLAKKTLRKALRTTNKFIKYSGSKQTEVELLLYFCKKLKETRISLKANTVVGNMYERQVQKIKKTLSQLHEDLQFDYKDEIDEL